VPGYKFLETKKLPNGDIEHVYEKVVTPTPTLTPFEYKVITTYVDENGELIIPDENGSHPGKELKGYEIVRTEKDENGNVRNIYRKVTTPETSIITTFVDENGNPILPNEIQITGSKSESNRLLILQKLFGNIEIKNYV